MGTNTKPAGGVKGAGGRGVKGATAKGAATGRVAGAGVVRRTSGTDTETVGIGPRINVSAAEFYTRNFESLNSGTRYILELFPVLFKQTLAELKDIFDRNELKLIIEAVLTLGYYSCFYKINVINAVLKPEHRGLFDKYNVDNKIIKKKVNNISNFQAFVIYQLSDILIINTRNLERDNEEFDIYKYISDLIGDDNLLFPGEKQVLLPWDGQVTNI